MPTIKTKRATAPGSSIGDSATTSKDPVLAERVQGIVKWFNVKNAYGSINCNDTREDIFVYQTAICMGQQPTEDSAQRRQRLGHQV